MFIFIQPFNSYCHYFVLASCCIMIPLRKMFTRKVYQSCRTKSVAVASFQNVRFCNTKTIRRHPLFILTEDEMIMKQMVGNLAKSKIGPLVKKMEAEGKIDDTVRQILFDNGLMGVETPVEYGGSGCNFTTMMLIIEELAKVDSSVALYVDVHNVLVNSLVVKVGNEEQKRKYLPLLASKHAGSFCLSEPHSGSDAFAMKTIAKKDGEHYIINGSKMWISTSDVAGIFVVMANANPTAGYKGITCFIIERDAPGLTVGKPESKLGIRASGTCMVNFDNVRIHESNMLGEFGKGYQYAAGFLNEGRIGVAAQTVGLCQACMDATIPYTLERKQFGKNIYSFQGMQFDIARISTKLECARLLTYNASRLKEAGLPFVKEACMAKYYSSEIAQTLTSKCIDWMGGVGFTTDFPQEKFYRDCKIGTIYEGTSNIQLQTIAKFIERDYTK